MRTSLIRMTSVYSRLKKLLSKTFNEVNDSDSDVFGAEEVNQEALTMILHALLDLAATENIEFDQALEQARARFIADVDQSVRERPRKKAAK